MEKISALNKENKDLLAAKEQSEKELKEIQEVNDTQVKGEIERIKADSNNMIEVLAQKNDDLSLLRIENEKLCEKHSTHLKQHEEDRKAHSDYEAKIKMLERVRNTLETQHAKAK